MHYKNAKKLEEIKTLIHLSHFEKITSFQFFRLCASFRKFHLVKEYPLASIGDFDLRKVVLRVGTCFDILKVYWTKSKN